MLKSVASLVTRGEENVMVPSPLTAKPAILFRRTLNEWSIIVEYLGTELETLFYYCQIELFSPGAPNEVCINSYQPTYLYFFYVPVS